MDSELYALVGLIYVAALDSKRWPIFLQRYADLVNAPAAALLYHDVSAQRGAVAPSIGVDADALREYNEHYASRDPWLCACEATGGLQTGTLFISEEIVPHPNLMRTEYYNDFARRYGLTRTLSAVIRRDDHITSSITAVRPDEHEPFTERERFLLQSLLPHLYRAMQVHRRVAGLESANCALLEAVDHIAIGVIGVRQSGTVAFANRAAITILDKQDGLSSRSDGIVAATRTETRALRALLQGWFSLLHYEHLSCWDLSISSAWRLCSSAIPNRKSRLIRMPFESFGA
jgi:hypothetical protein